MAGEKRQQFPPRLYHDGGNIIRNNDGETRYAVMILAPERRQDHLITLGQRGQMLHQEFAFHQEMIESFASAVDSATLEEKIAAWQEIVGYVPSCPWDDALDIRERVAAYIDLQEEMLGQFQSADSLTGETDSGSVYRSYKDCLAAAIHAAHAAGCCKLEIRKEPLNAAEHSRRIGTCLFNQDGEIMQINCLLRQSTLPGQAE